MWARKKCANVGKMLSWLRKANVVAIYSFITRSTVRRRRTCSYLDLSGLSSAKFSHFECRNARWESQYHMTTKKSSLLDFTNNWNCSTFNSTRKIAHCNPHPRKSTVWFCASQSQLKIRSTLYCLIPTYHKCEDENLLGDKLKVFKCEGQTHLNTGCIYSCWTRETCRLLGQWRFKRSCPWGRQELSFSCNFLHLSLGFAYMKLRGKRLISEFLLIIKFKKYFYSTNILCSLKVFYML